LEKVMYQVWKAESQTGEAFKKILIGELAAGLENNGVRGYRVCVADDHAASSRSVRIVNTKPQPDAFLSLWVDSAIRLRRVPIDELIATCVARFHGYLVTESEPMPNVDHLPSSPGERTPGINQLVMLRKPNRINYEHWLEIWLNSHSIVGMGTQSTFGYRQNIVVRPLTYAAPAYDAFIEENFPEESMHDLEHYYDQQGEKKAEWDGLIEANFPGVTAAGDGDEETPRWHRNIEIMQQSVDRFIDHGQTPYLEPKIDCIPYSEFLLKAV
jgi:hypothetical protein